MQELPNPDLDGRLPPPEKDGPSYSRGIFGEKQVNGRQFHHLEEQKVSSEEARKRKNDIINQLPKLDIANSNKEDFDANGNQRFQPIQEDPEE